MTLFSNGISSRRYECNMSEKSNSDSTEIEEIRENPIRRSGSRAVSEHQGRTYANFGFSSRNNLHPPRDTDELIFSHEEDYRPVKNSDRNHIVPVFERYIETDSDDPRDRRMEMWAGEPISTKHIDSEDDPLR